MNKKKRNIIIIAVTAALIMMVIPFSYQIYKDGGTRVYTALTYKIVDFNKLTKNGEIYDQTKVYPFPMNFMSDDFLMASANGASVQEKDKAYRENLLDKFSALINGDTENSAYTKDEGKENGETPPPMEITYDVENTLIVNADTFCWTYIDSKGEVNGICADALHPLESREYMKEFTAKSDKVKISFSVEPDSIEVRCWPDSCWGKTGASFEKADVDKGAISLKNGGYIYQVTGIWNDETLKDADASYSFYAVLN